MLSGVQQMKTCQKCRHEFTEAELSAVPDGEVVVFCADCMKIINEKSKQWSPLFAKQQF